MLDPRPFRFFRNLNRTRQIATVLLKFGFGDVLSRLPRSRSIAWTKRLVFRKPSEPVPRMTRPRRFRLALESLGPTFIKFGQVLSTRPDLLPEELIDELALLQERVPAFESSAARLRIETEFGSPVEELFASFEDEPIAAGSLGQVHRATLFDGRIVAVKVRRPGVVRVIERDLSVMTEFASLVDRYVAELKPFDPVGLVKHFAKTIRRELNFYREARTIEEFERLFETDATLHVPRVVWELCSESIVTMEFVDGLRLTEPDKLRERGIDPREVAANGARIFMKQAFELGLFHGDPHPGNVRVLRDGSICLLDFGMVGILEEQRRDELVDLLLAISRQDVRAAVRIVLTIGRGEGPCEERLLAADLRDFINNYYGVELERVKLGPLLGDFMRILSEHRIRCPPNLMLLIRALVSLEGVGRSLDPAFNLAAHLAPFVEKVVRRRYSPGHLYRRGISEARHISRLLHEVPTRLNNVLDRLERDELAVIMRHEVTSDLKTELDRVSNRVVIGVVLSSLILSSAVIISSGSSNLWFSVPVFLFSSLLGIWLISAVFSSGRI